MKYPWDAPFPPQELCSFTWGEKTSPWPPVGGRGLLRFPGILEGRGRVLENTDWWMTFGVLWISAALCYVIRMIWMHFWSFEVLRRDKPDRWRCPSIQVNKYLQIRASRYVGGKGPFLVITHLIPTFCGRLIPNVKQHVWSMYADVSFKVF